MPKLETVGVLLIVRAGNGRPYIGPTLVLARSPRAPSTREEAREGDPLRNKHKSPEELGQVTDVLLDLKELGVTVTVSLNPEQFFRDAINQSGLVDDPDTPPEFVALWLQELVRAFPSWRAGLILQSSGVALSAIFELASRAQVAATNQFLERHGHARLTTAQVAKIRKDATESEGRKYRDLEIRGRKLLRHRRGGATVVRKRPTRDQLARFYPLVEALCPAWREALAIRRDDPHVFNNAIMESEKVQNLTEAHQRTFEKLAKEIKEIGTDEPKINGAKVEARVCAREHARRILGIEKRADSKLRALYKESLQLNGATSLN